MTSPRDLAQAASTDKKLTYYAFEKGKWTEDKVRKVVVLRSPDTGYVFALHQPALKFFRSVTRGSGQLTATSLRTVIATDRLWLQHALKKVIPGGDLLLAFERGDTAATGRAKQRFDPSSPAPKLAPQAVPTISAFQPTTAASMPVSQGSLDMSLLDVQTSTKRIIMEEVAHTLDLDRMQFIGILRGAGAKLPRDVQIRLLHGNGQAIDFDDTAKIRLTWSEVKETEENS